MSTSGAHQRSIAIGRSGDEGVSLRVWSDGL
jgi:hypothetical protein